MSDLGPKPAYFWDETTKTFRKAVVGEPGEYVWNTTTNAWEFGTVGAEYVYNHTTKSWEFGPGGQYVRNTSTNSWDKVTSPGYGGPYYWDTSTNSWLKNAASIDVAEAYARWDFINNQAWFGGDYVGALSSTPGWSFTRASTGYAQTSAGVLVPFASGELRRTDKGVLIEGARTNLCLQSQTFDNASWTKSRSSITANAIVAPDGTTTADKLVEDATAASTHRVYQYVDKAASAITYTGSVYAKAAERNFVSVKLTDNTETDQVAVGVNLTTGELTAVASPGGGFTGGVATATALSDGWWRITLTATSDTDTRVTLFAQVSNILSTTPSYQGDGASGIYIWGAQIEAAAFPSSYIPTTTASATRAADVLTVPVSGIDYPLSLYAEFERAVDTGGIEYSLFLDDGDATDRAALYVGATDKVTVLVTSGSAAQAAAEVNAAVSIGASTKCAARVATNDTIAASAGVLGAQDTSVTLPATPTTIRFGQNSAGGSQPFGYLRRAAIYSRALTNAELTALTL